MRGNINAIRWLAPEVLKDDSSSFAVDIWSLGLVIYELLTLNTPYFDINPLEITSHIKLGNRPTTPKKTQEFKSIIHLFEICTYSNAEQRPTIKEVKKLLKNK